MKIAQILIMVLVAIGIVATYYILKYKNIKFNTLTYKITSLVLALIFFFRFMLGDDAIQNVFQLTNSPFNNNALTVVSIIFNWIFLSAVLAVILYPFFKTSRYVALVKYYCFVVGLVSMGLVTILTTGIVGTSAYSGFQIRTLLLGLEIGIVTGYSAVVFLDNNYFKVEKKDLWVFAYIVGMLLATMPGYTFQALFGYANYTAEIKSLHQAHRIILYLSIVIPVVMYFVLHKKDNETIRGILLYIALGTLISFSVGHRFESFTHITSWPIHLCNTAMYIVPLCLIFKWDKLFYFTYFINVLGAFLAMAMPNYSAEANILSQRVVTFYINHYIAFFMPLLMVALKVYARPKIKQFKYSMIGFGAYFVLVLVLNAWFSNYGTVDYFFVNSDFIADKLGKWAQNLFYNHVWSFNIKNLTFTFYPLYQLCFFLVYVALGFAMWFLYEQFYDFEDTVKVMVERNRKINIDRLALEIAKIERSKIQMKEDAKVKLELINFSKRYGTSKNYAVKDANLEVNGGEIFGFLGHNGAGKSTIIKSIVGIQPITSGAIKVCGYDVDKEPVMTKLNIGFVPDHYALYEKLTGREYINYIADLYNVSEKDRNKALEKYIKLFQLENAIDNPIKTYSHGMKQKITIMSALVHNPKVWILDEPLTGLDPNSIYQVKECMKAHAKAGNIVFFSSHIIDVVESICDRIAIIKKGQILTVKTMAEIEEECGLEQFYLKTIDPSGYEKLEQKIEQKIEEKETETSSEEAEKMTAESVSESKAKIESKLTNETENKKKKGKGN